MLEISCGAQDLSWALRNVWTAVNGWRVVSWEKFWNMWDPFISQGISNTHLLRLIWHQWDLASLFLVIWNHEGAGWISTDPRNRNYLNPWTNHSSLVPCETNPEANPSESGLSLSMLPAADSVDSENYQVATNQEKLPGTPITLCLPVRNCWSDASSVPLPPSPDASMQV